MCVELKTKIRMTTSYEWSAGHGKEVQFPPLLLSASVHQEHLACAASDMFSLGFVLMQPHGLQQKYQEL